MAFRRAGKMSEGMWTGGKGPSCQQSIAVCFILFYYFYQKCLKLFLWVCVVSVATHSGAEYGWFVFWLPFCWSNAVILGHLSVYRLHGGITFMCLGFCSPSRGWSLKTKLSGFILKHRQKRRIRTLHQQEHAQSIHFLRNDIRFISRNCFVSQPKKISLKARYKLKNWHQFRENLIPCECPKAPKKGVLWTILSRWYRIQRVSHGWCLFMGRDLRGMSMTYVVWRYPLKN